MCLFLTSFHMSTFLFFFLNVPVKEKVTLSLPLPGMVHRRDISTKGAAVCLISPAQMGRQKSLGQPWVYWPSLTSIVLMETAVRRQAKVRSTINSQGEIISTWPITYFTKLDRQRHHRRSESNAGCLRGVPYSHSAQLMLKHCVWGGRNNVEVSFPGA